MLKTILAIACFIGVFFSLSAQASTAVCYSDSSPLYLYFCESGNPSAWVTEDYYRHYRPQLGVDCIPSDQEHLRGNPTMSTLLADCEERLHGKKVTFN